MTEAEWLACDEPVELLDSQRNRTSERKVRLCVCACSRLVWSLFRDQRSKAAVEIAERCADQTTPDLRSMQTAYFAALEVGDEVIAQHSGMRELSITHAAAGAAAPVGTLDFNMVFHTAGDLAEPHQLRPVAIVREIFGNPFRPVHFDPAWRTDTALTLARQMYESREFGAAPILADALQDAGCDADDLLNHLRDPHAAHVRGCWALDLVLGKE